MDLIRQLGELAIGSRLKRLSDYILGNGVDIYKLYGIDFNPHWFPIYYALTKNEKMGIMELATELQMSHPAIIKLAKELESNGYIQSIKGEEDKRKRFLKLTKEGKEMLPEMELVWKDIAQSLGQMVGNHQNNLLGAVSAFESDFKSLGFVERVEKMRKKRLQSTVEIIDYAPEYAEDFKRINYDWIKKYFKIEEADVRALEQHKEKIIDTGGWIFFARVEDKIVGTCALVKANDDLFELAKMGVYEEYRGWKIGQKLGEAIIRKAKEMGGKTLFLESNKSLTPAIKLYEKLGFQEIPTKSPSEYERSDIKMEMKL